jgi:hypothetical protein
MPARCRRAHYGGIVVCHCAWPDKAPRRHPGWNVRTVAGWKTKREAQDIARRLNEALPRDVVRLTVPSFSRIVEV